MNPRLGASGLGTVHSSVELATNNQILRSSDSYELVFNSYIIRSPEEGSPAQGWQLGDDGTELSAILWSFL